VIRITHAFVFFALTSAAFGQLRGPVLGYVPDGSSLRAMHGIPAAGAVGDALSAGRHLALVEVSPSQTLALATASDTGELLVLTPNADDSGLLTASVSGATAGANKIVFSPSGTAAALWFSSTGHIQILQGLASAPTVRDLDASFVGGDPAALAVSDDGQWAIGAWSNKVYAFGPNSQVNVLPVDGGAQALCFFHSKAAVAVFTPTQIVTISDLAGSTVPTVLWSQSAAAAASSAPIAAGLAVSFDNAHLTVAGSTGALFTFDLATGAGVAADCGCAPTGLSGLGGSVVRLTGVNAGAVKVFDAATNEVWFVPLAAPAVNGGQQ
jgi:hypothetical protein